MTRDIRDQPGDALIGLYLYGSLVTGDFDAERSDLDLLSLTRADLREGQVEALREMHARLVEDVPEAAAPHEPDQPGGAAAPD